jgi:hypothetical protein
LSNCCHGEQPQATPQHAFSKSKNLLTIRPINVTEAVAFVIKHHRRLDAPSAGHKFAIAVEDDFFLDVCPPTKGALS